MANPHEPLESPLAPERALELPTPDPTPKGRAPLNLDALSVLAGGVAHHFNNLLCVILGYAEMLMDELSGRDEWMGQAREIYTAADKAAALAQQLLAFSRKQRGTVEVVDPNAMIQGLESLLRPMVTEAVVLELDLDPAVPHVRANRMQLELCLLNLVLNAKEAMPDGGVLTIRTSGHAGYAKIAVTDTGRGIPKEIRERLFEPFFTTKDVGQGTGMGLSMVHGIVHQAGGDVRVHSAPGEGSTFTMLLPETKGEVLAPASQPTMVASEGTESVLVCEDEERVRRLVVKTLSRQGYSVVAACNADEAMRLIKERGAGLQLLVTDVVLPGMNGLDLARAAKIERPDLAVLYISGYGLQDLARYGSLDRDVTLLSKPFRPPELIGAVRRVLDAANARSDVTSASARHPNARGIDCEEAQE